jgi:2-keto-4-pentenoate hydratase
MYMFFDPKRRTPVTADKGACAGMIIGMTEARWDEFGKIMNTLSQEQRNAIAHNIRCYEQFLTYPG